MLRVHPVELAAELDHDGRPTRLNSTVDRVESALTVCIGLYGWSSSKRGLDSNVRTAIAIDIRLISGNPMHLVIADVRDVSDYNGASIFLATIHSFTHSLHGHPLR